MSEEYINAVPEAQAPQDSSQQQTSRTFTQEQLNAIVGREKMAAAERERRQAEERHKAEIESLRSTGVDKSALIAEVKAQMVQEFQQHQQQREQEKTQAQLAQYANNYIEHVKGVQVEPEDDPVGIFSNPEPYAQLALMVGELNMENTVDIMKELARKPGKLSSAYTAALTGNKALLKAQLVQIDKSIRQNKEALENEPKVNAPLSRVKPSATGSRVDYSKYTLADWKKHPALR